jgi:hypothetical protein
MRPLTAFSGAIPWTSSQKPDRRPESQCFTPASLIVRGPIFREKRSIAQGAARPGAAAVQAANPLRPGAAESTVASERVYAFGQGGVEIGSSARGGARWNP